MNDMAKPLPAATLLELPSLLDVWWQEVDNDDFIELPNPATGASRPYGIRHRSVGGVVPLAFMGEYAHEK